MENVRDKQILNELYKILIEQYTLKPNSRTMIFVNTRICAQNLSAHLNEYLRENTSLPIFTSNQKVVGFLTSKFLNYLFFKR